MQLLVCSLILTFTIGGALLAFGYAISAFLFVSKVQPRSERQNRHRYNVNWLRSKSAEISLALLSVSHIWAFGFDLVFFAFEASSLLLERHFLGVRLHSCLSLFSLASRFSTVFHVSSTSVLDISGILEFRSAALVRVRLLLLCGWFFSWSTALSLWSLHHPSLGFLTDRLSFSSHSQLVRYKYLTLDICMSIILLLVTIWFLSMRLRGAALQKRLTVVEHGSSSELHPLDSLTSHHIQISVSRAVFLQLLVLLASRCVFLASQLSDQPRPVLGCVETLLHLFAQSLCLVLFIRNLRLVLSFIQRNPPPRTLLSEPNGSIESDRCRYQTWNWLLHEPNTAVDSPNSASPRHFRKHRSAAQVLLARHGAMGQRRKSAYPSVP